MKHGSISTVEIRGLKQCDKVPRSFTWTNYPIANKGLNPFLYIMAKCVQRSGDVRMGSRCLWGAPGQRAWTGPLLHLRERHGCDTKSYNYWKVQHLYMGAGPTRYPT